MCSRFSGSGQSVRREFGGGFRRQCKTCPAVTYLLTALLFLYRPTDLLVTSIEYQRSEHEEISSVSTKHSIRIRCISKWMSQTVFISRNLVRHTKIRIRYTENRTVRIY